MVKKFVFCIYFMLFNIFNIFKVFVLNNVWCLLYNSVIVYLM